jgi:DNA-binding NarL/FixJ family response regulator
MASAARARDNTAAMGASVLIVDDRPGFRVLARRLLDGDGYRVVGEAGDCGSPPQGAPALGPELRLVDVGLPNRGGIELSPRLLELAVPPAVVLISSRDRAEVEWCRAQCGASEFLPKSELSREAIEEVLR